MKNLKLKLLLLSIFIFPFNVLAYSNKVILGGENLGIHVDTSGVLVVGFYEVNKKSPAITSNIKVGDYIIAVNNEEIKSIDDLTAKIEEYVIDDTITLTVKRDGEEKNILLKLEKQDGIYKTGLYVKDSINGIGTLTYIDPETHVYGALGHEIVESNTNKKVEIKNGAIFESNVLSITKSIPGTTGEKNANFKQNNTYGSIKTNTNNGIFGIWKNEIKNDTFEVAQNDEIKIGPAKMYTVINGNEKKEYDIKITSIQTYNDTKNMTFEIVSDELINKAGGIVQGMSGSPIVQNGKIIGAVTHVIVDKPITGYAIFITTMLKKGDTILE